MTNTQTIVDAPHKDLRRARAASLSLIPTTTGSATAIGLIFPELEGRLNGLAVRVPLLNASLTDCVFEVARPTTVEEVNGLLRGGGRRPARADPRLRGAAARLGRLQGRPALGDRRRALDDGHRRDAGEDPRLVRQRVGLREPPRRAGGDRRRRPRPRRRRRASAAAEAARATRRRAATCATTRSSPAPTGPTRSPTARSGCSCSSTSTSSATRRSQLASLFLFYEIFGIVTNLVGGWLAARFGLKATLLMGLGTQICALAMLGARARRAGSSSRT